MKRIHIDRDSVPPAILAATGYNGRKFQVRPSESVTFRNLNWSGGTRSTYIAVSLSSGAIASASRANTLPPWANPYEGQSYDIPAGVAIVERVMFCGKDYGLVIYANPADIAPLLPAPIELTADESIVLECACAYIAKARRSEAAYQGVSPSRYDAALTSLVVKKLLTRAFGVTTAGRNANPKG